jgi:hypothetical protein
VAQEMAIETEEGVEDHEDLAPADGDSRLAIPAELTKPGIESSDNRFAPDSRCHVEHALDLRATLTYTGLSRWLPFRD